MERGETVTQVVIEQMKCKKCGDTIEFYNGFNGNAKFNGGHWVICAKCYLENFTIWQIDALKSAIERINNEKPLTLPNPNF